MDVKSAFLYGELEKTVYMEKPRGLDFLSENENVFENKVLKLNKSLYGLKVSSKRWFLRFKEFITSKASMNMFFKLVFLFGEDETIL